MATPGNPFTPPGSGSRGGIKTPRGGATGTRNTVNPLGGLGVTPPPTGGRQQLPPGPIRDKLTDDSRVTKQRKRSKGLKLLENREKRKQDPELEAQLVAAGIDVYLPSHVEYERSVASSNLLYRFSRPTYVVQPHTHSQVSLIVTEAIARKMPLAIKNGGHSYVGSSFPNDGIMLDMKKMNGVEFDKDGRTMTIQGGALWGNVYRVLVDTEDGYMVNGGRCPTVGVSGFILGGGIGPFSRQYGMACDNVLEITIAAADGELYCVSPADDKDTPEGQLFWALCGAGGANFGVVCEIKIQVHIFSSAWPAPNEKPKQVVAGRHTWFPTVDRSPPSFFASFTTPARAPDSTGLLGTMNHFYTTAWPDRMTIDSSWFSDLEVRNGDIAVRFLTYFDGDQKEFNKLINRGILNAELSKQIERRSLVENSSRFLHETLFAQWDEEAKRSTPANSSFRIFHSFCFEKKPEDIAKITAIIKEELEAFKRLFSGEGSGLCQVSWIHSGGQMSRRDLDATAFRWRKTDFHTYIMLQWRDKWLERDMRGFATKFKNRLRQFSIAGKASFINFPDASIPKDDVTKAYYGNNRDKLALVKRTWDPDNFFRWDLDEGIKVAEEDHEQAQAQADKSSKVEEEELSDADEEGPDTLTDKVAHSRWEERDTFSYEPLLTNYNDPAQINMIYGGDYLSSGPPDSGYF